MAKSMRVAIIVFPGSNREHDAKKAFEAVCIKQIDFIWHKDKQFHDRPDLIIVPGGFAWGDYLRAGAISAHSEIMKEVKHASKQHGTRIIGICNGFQILCEAGLLEGALMRNKNLQFLCKPVHLKVEHNQSPLTAHYRDGQVVTFPIAHHDGNYFANPETLARLEDNNQILLRYCTPDGALTEAANLNGSQQNIAGICNEQGNVMGMMPHPENAIYSYHPSHDGLKLFAGLCHA